MPGSLVSFSTSCGLKGIVALSENLTFTNSHQPQSSLSNSHQYLSNISGSNFTYSIINKMNLIDLVFSLCIHSIFILCLYFIVFIQLTTFPKSFIPILQKKQVLNLKNKKFCAVGNHACNVSI